MTSVRTPDGAASVVGHTPGPWFVGDSGEVYSRAPCTSICTAWRVLPVAEAEANASLIAAAPDLLAALIDARASLMAACFSDEQDRADAAATLNDIDAALSKARGLQEKQK